MADLIKPLIKSLKEKNLVVYDQHELLLHNFGRFADGIFKTMSRMQKSGVNIKGVILRKWKQFGMTVHYYSPKAYDFVWKLMVLPHLSSIRTWTVSVDCEPRYLFNVIKLIRKKGTVGLGTAVQEPAQSLAMEALVFMIVGMTGYWKHPTQYALQDKCPTNIQVYLIKDCIELTHTEGLNVLAVVF